MMKIVPASRLVTDASLDPPSTPRSIERNRAITPAGKVAADCASITAKQDIPTIRRAIAALARPINDSLRFGWVWPVSLSSSRKRGPITTDRSCLNKVSTSVPRYDCLGVWVPAFAGTTVDLLQIDIEFVGVLAADQRQFERGSFGVRARR